jgi:hypothetical protein
MRSAYRREEEKIIDAALLQKKTSTTTATFSIISEGVKDSIFGRIKSSRI